VRKLLGSYPRILRVPAAAQVRVGGPGVESKARPTSREPSVHTSPQLDRWSVERYVVDRNAQNDALNELRARGATPVGRTMIQSTTADLTKPSPERPSTGGGEGHVAGRTYVGSGPSGEHSVRQASEQKSKMAAFSDDEVVRKRASPGGSGTTVRLPFSVEKMARAEGPSQDGPVPTGNVELKSYGFAVPLTTQTLFNAIAHQQANRVFTSQAAAEQFAANEITEFENRFEWQFEISVMVFKDSAGYHVGTPIQGEGMTVSIGNVGFDEAKNSGGTPVSELHAHPETAGLGFSTNDVLRAEQTGIKIIAVEAKGSTIQSVQFDKNGVAHFGCSGLYCKLLNEHPYSKATTHPDSFRSDFPVSRPAALVPQFDISGFLSGIGGAGSWPWPGPQAPSNDLPTPNPAPNQTALSGSSSAGGGGTYVPPVTGVDIGDPGDSPPADGVAIPGTSGVLYWKDGQLRLWVDPDAAIEGPTSSADGGAVPLAANNGEESTSGWG
jgi:hypothetical protein